MFGLTLFSNVSRVAGLAAMCVAMCLMVYMVLHISVEITLRSFFDASTYSMDEYVGYAVGAMTFLALADTFREGKHIRVGLLHTRLNARMAKVVEVLCILFTFGISLFLVRFIWRMLVRDYQRGSVSPTMNETPMWLIDGVIFVGLALFMIQLAASLVDVLKNTYLPEISQGD